MTPEADRVTHWRLGTSLICAAALAACSSGAAHQESAAAAPSGAVTHLAPIDWAPVGQALGKAGSVVAGDVYKAGFPRSDLEVTIGGLRLAPALALGSWAAFKQVSDTEVIALGDLVLVESEVGGVVRALEEGGIDVTALHNHLAGEVPAVRYLHFAARGPAVRVATALHSALATTGTPMTSPAGGPPPALPDTAAIARALGRSGRANGGVYQVSVPRAEPVQLDGVEVPPAMGVATAINFEASSGGRAAATGDFVLTATEVNPVIRALESHGIEVTALHNHMLGETPRLFFMHFWGQGDASGLAGGLRSALDAMGVAVRR